MLPPSIPDPRSTKIPESPTKLRYFIENSYPNLLLLDTTYLPTRTTYMQLLDTTDQPPRVCHGSLYPTLEEIRPAGSEREPKALAILHNRR
jgi:hypothetical protein